MAGPGEELKVIRDSDGNNTTFEESIEIPPPRPKRKPTHPYPRKLVEIPKNEISNLEQPLRSNSLRSLDFGQENKSPKSVLSAVVSETLGSSDSDTPTGSLSPVSSISAAHTSSFPLFEPKSSPDEDVSPPPDGLNAGSTNDDKQPLVKLEHFSKESVSTEDDAADESPGRTFKLFGTTLLVRDTCKPSSPSSEASKPIPSMQIQSGCSDIEGGVATIVPWWTFSHNTSFMPLHKEHEGKHLNSSHGECEDKEVQKEGSFAGSNTSSINDGENSERSSYDQAKSDDVHYLVGHTTPSETVRPKTFGKGFVPYKRCMTERENQCPTLTYEKREEQRIRLSL